MAVREINLITPNDVQIPLNFRLFLIISEKKRSDPLYKAFIYFPLVYGSTLFSGIIFNMCLSNLYSRHLLSISCSFSFPVWLASTWIYGTLLLPRCTFNSFFYECSVLPRFLLLYLNCNPSSLFLPVCFGCSFVLAFTFLWSLYTWEFYLHLK